MYVNGKHRPPEGGKPQAAKAVSINNDSDLAAQLAALWFDDGTCDPPAHDAKVALAAPKGKSDDISAGLNAAGISVVPIIDSGCTNFAPVAPAEPASSTKSTEGTGDGDDLSAPTTGLESLLRAGGTSIASTAIGAARATKSAIMANRATIFCMAFLFLSLAIAIPLVSGSLGAMNSAALHPAVESVPTDSVRPSASSDNQGLAVTHSRPRAPSLSESWGILIYLAWLAGTLLVFKPCYFWYIACSFPFDVARVVSYCLTAPLAALPPVYHAVLGLGQGSASFLTKTVGSINKLRRYGGPFLILAAIAVGLSRLSPFAHTDTTVETMISAPAFPNASTAPAVSDVSLPYRGAWLPSELEKGGGVVHSYNSALIGGDCTENSAFNELMSKSISTLPIVSATVDSGCSASCTHDCHLLTNTTACDEVFGAANGVLAQATMIGNLPLIARTSNGTFIHFVLTNVRCVPEFSNFTLLSVDQMWEEQSVKSLFCDSKQLELPSCSGGHVIPYDETAGRNTLKFASAVQLYEKGILTKHTAANVRPHSALGALGFHDIKATAHVARLSGAQVGELMHRLRGEFQS